MWGATVIDTAQTRERSKCLGQLQRSPACEENRWMEKNNNIKGKKKKKNLFIHLNQ